MTSSQKTLACRSVNFLAGWTMALAFGVWASVVLTFAAPLTYVLATKSSSWHLIYAYFWALIAGSLLFWLLKAQYRKWDKLLGARIALELWGLVEVYQDALHNFEELMTYLDREKDGSCFSIKSWFLIEHLGSAMSRILKERIPKLRSVEQCLQSDPQLLPWLARK